MILTTHLMEEAEVLSDRIGIIVNGSLKCLGTQYKLKKIYGKGFKLVINLTINVDEDEINFDDKIENCENFVKNLFQNSKITEKFKNTIIFQVIFAL